MSNGYRVLCQPLRVGIGLYRRGLQRCRSHTLGNARASNRGTATVELHVFLVCLFVTINLLIKPHNWSSYARKL